MRRDDGLTITRSYREALEASGVPVEKVYLYGSVARDEATEDSDIDVAVVCMPFGATRHEENMVLRHVRWGVDLRISPYCLHPDDFTDRSFFPLAGEVERTGVEV